MSIRIFADAYLTALIQWITVKEKEGDGGTRQMVQVSRDSFSRADIVREVIKTRMGCQWCGGQRAKGGLFQYSVWHDSGRVARIPGEFCGIGCMRSYHN